VAGGILVVVRLIVIMRFGHEGRRVGHTAMAGATGDGIVGFVIAAQLGEVFRVEVVRHFDHEAGCVLERVCIGGEVVAFRLGVAGVAESTFDAEVGFVLMHEFVDVVAGDVFRKSLDIGWSGLGTMRRSRGLWRSWVLSEGERSRKECYKHCCERASTESIHPGKTLFVEEMA
jgi:hypothetical protein